MPSVLERLEALNERATEGPWLADPDLAEYDAGLHNVWHTNEHGDQRAVAHDIFKFEDADFIAAARNALPDLLAVAKAARVVRRTHKDGGVYDRDCSIARRELYEALAPLLREVE